MIIEILKEVGLQDFDIVYGGEEDRVAWMLAQQLGLLRLGVME